MGNDMFNDEQLASARDALGAGVKNNPRVGHPPGTVEEALSWLNRLAHGEPDLHLVSLRHAVGFAQKEIAALRLALETATREAEEERRTAEAAVKFLGRIAEVTWEAGLPSGDREQTLKNVRALVSRPAPPADAAREAVPRGFPPSLIREATEEAKTWLSAPYSNHGPQAVVDARGIMFRLLSVIHEFTAASVLSISGMHDTCDLCQRDIPDGCYAVFCGECEDGMRAAFDGVKRALAPAPAPAPSTPAKEKP